MDGANAARQQKLPQRDWLLLPLCSAVAVLLTLSPLEIVSRILFQGGPSDSLSCMVLNDTKGGPHAIPNSECSFKVPESGWVDYRFNSRGHRAGTELGPKEPGTYRIVLVGTSMAEGLHVPWNQTFAALLPKELSRETGRKVEVYNEALEWESPHRIDMHLQDVLDAQPDAILWAVTKWDVENASLLTPSPAMRRVKVTDGLGRWARAWRQTVDLFTSNSVSQSVDESVKHVFQVVCPGTVFLFEHFLYENEYEYVKSFLTSGNDTAFLEARPDEGWQEQLHSFDHYVSDVETRAAAAGVPVIATVLPPRIEATLISLGRWPQGLDPYRFGDQVRNIFENHGGTYLDLLHDFRFIRHAERYYFPVDGHPNAAGQLVFFDSLCRRLAPRVASAQTDAVTTAAATIPKPLPASSANQSADKSRYQLVKYTPPARRRPRRARRTQHVGEVRLATKLSS